MKIEKDADMQSEEAISKRERTRRHILDEAKHVFADKGYAAANVVDIVERLNVSHGSFYYHFKDKKATLLDMLNEFFDKVKNMAAAWAETTDTSANTAESFIRGVSLLLYENRELALIVLREDYRAEPDIKRLIDETTEFLYERTARALEVGIALGSVRPIDARLAAVASIGMIKEVVFDIIARGGEFDIDYVVREISELQNFGIRPRMPDAK